MAIRPADADQQSSDDDRDDNDDVEPENATEDADGERVDAVPAVFKKIHLNFKVSGNGLEENKVKRAVELSAERYCSASIMLKNAGVEISHSFEISAA